MEFIILVCCVKFHYNPGYVIMLCTILQVCLGMEICGNDFKPMGIPRICKFYGILCEFPVGFFGPLWVFPVSLYGLLWVFPVSLYMLLWVFLVGFCGNFHRNPVGMGTEIPFPGQTLTIYY